MMSGWGLPESPVTVMFTDIEGSTEMRTRLGDERANELTSIHDRIIREQLEVHSGNEVKTIGDAFLCWFASPRKAISCALGIQRAMAATDLRIRVGLHTGEVQESGDDIAGEAVVAAKRIEDLARPARIYCSSVTRMLAGTVPGVRFVDQGEFELKGFPEPCVVYEVDSRVAPRRSDGPTPFVGRTAELADLRRRLDDARRGRGSLVLVSGEPGIGKTRLVRQLCEEAESTGLVVRWGRCYETDGAPYLPVVEMIEESIAAHDSGTFRAILGDEGGEVAKVVPMLRRKFVDLPAPLDLPAEQERRYLFRAITTVARRSAERAPHVYVFDDLQWADEATLLFVENFAEQVADAPILVVGTYRDTDLEVGRPLHRSLDRLYRSRLGQRVALKPLSDKETRGMLTSLAGQEVPPALVNAIAAETDGNAFFVEEVFAHLVEEGKLFDDDGLMRSDLVIEELDVPEGVRLVVGRRLERLASTTLRMLETAAVVGRGVRLDLLDRVTGLGRAGIVDAADEAESAGVLRVEEGDYVFSHALIRQTLLSSLSLARRQDAHAAVAEALEALAPDPEELDAAAIAHHLVEAGVAADPSQTVRFLHLAGLQALEAAAFEEAHEHLEQALRLGRLLDDAARAGLLRDVGLARRAVGRWDEAAEVWEQALELFVADGNPDVAGELVTELLHRSMWVAPPDVSLTLVERGVGVIENLSASSRASLLAQVALIRMQTADFDGVAAAVEEALTLLPDVRAPRARAIVLDRVGRALINTGQWKAGRPFLAEAADEVRRHVGPYELCDLLSCDAVWRINEGDLDGGREAALEAQALTERFDGFEYLGLLALAFAAPTLAVVSGNLDDYDRQLANVIDRVFELDYHWHNAKTWIGYSAFFRGHWDAALPYFEEGANEEIPVPAFDGFGRSALVRHLGHLGLRDRAEQVVQGLSMPVLGTPCAYASAFTAVQCLEAFAMLGDRARVASIAPTVVDLRDRGFVLAGPDRLVDTAAGVGLAAAEDWGAAVEHFEEALSLAHSMPHVIEQGDARRFYASMLLDRRAPGDRDRADQLLGEAISVYRRVGMPRHVQMAEELRDIEAG